MEPTERFQIHHFGLVLPVKWTQLKIGIQTMEHNAILPLLLATLNVGMLMAHILLLRLGSYEIGTDLVLWRESLLCH